MVMGFVLYVACTIHLILGILPGMFQEGSVPALGNSELKVEKNNTKLFEIEINSKMLFLDY